MKEIKTEINDAYLILSQLSVSGDAVDLMAAVRAKMKRALRMMNDLEKGEADGRQTD